MILGMAASFVHTVHRITHRGEHNLAPAQEAGSR